MLSSGIGNAWPMRRPCSIATAVPKRLRQVRGDRRGLRQHPQRLAAPDLVAAAGGRIVLARGERQRRIHDRIHARQLAEALGHEPAASGNAGTPDRYGASGARPSRCLRGRWNRSCRRPCSARAARAPSGRGGARPAAIRTARGSRARRARCRRGSASSGARRGVGMRPFQSRTNSWKLTSQISARLTPFMRAGMAVMGDSRAKVVRGECHGRSHGGAIGCSAAARPGRERKGGRRSSDQRQRAPRRRVGIACGGFVRADVDGVFHQAPDASMSSRTRA